MSLGEPVPLANTPPLLYVTHWPGRCSATAAAAGNRGLLLFDHQHHRQYIPSARSNKTATQPREGITIIISHKVRYIIFLFFPSSTSSCPSCSLNATTTTIDSINQWLYSSSSPSTCNMILMIMVISKRPRTFLAPEKLKEKNNNRCGCVTFN